MLNFTSNHDENSWQGSAIERIHYLLEPLTVLTFLLPGIPLIYSGQEAGNYRRLKFFDKDRIDWQEDKMFDLYKILVDIRKQNPDLWSHCNIQKIENDTNDTVVSLQISDHKQISKVILFLNLSNKNQTFYIKCGKYTGNFTNLISKENCKINCHNAVNLKAFGYKILESV